MNRASDRRPEAGHAGIARGLTYLLGRATCPACTNDFAVAEQVEESYR